MSIVFQQILPFFSIIGLGWIIAHFKIANQDWNKVIGRFALYIGFPALIFSGLSIAPIESTLLAKSFGYNSLILLSIIAVLLVSFNFFNFNNSDKSTYIICFIFGNVAFLGIPLITAINQEFQQEATLNTAVHLFWIFSIGLFIVEYYASGKPNFIKISFSLLKNPLLIAVILGLAFNFMNIKLAPFLFKSINMLGSAVSSIVMLMIGIFIKTNPVSNIKQLTAPLIYSSLKLIVIPIICVLGFHFANIKNENLATIADFAMPVAITPFALSEVYPLNKQFISNSIVISTIISILTIPFIIQFTNWI